MKILLIHQYFVDHDHPGGTRHFELVSPLVCRGHEVTVVASSVDYLSGRPIAGAKGWITEQTLCGIRVLRAYTYPSVHRSFAWRVASFLSFMATSVWAGLRAGPVDVVVGTSPPIFQLFSAWLIAVVRRRPFLLEIRDLWPEFAVDIGILKNPVLIATARWFERFMYARATHLLVNSPAYRDYLLEKGIPDHKISVIPNGVDPNMFHPNQDGAAMRDELGLDGRFVVAYTGALGMANDIGTILRAADRLRDEPAIHFLLVGGGKEKNRLEDEARSLGLSNVTFAGTFPKNRIAEVLAASDACVATLRDIPMFRTTYPNKVFDYMAAGRPIVLGIDGVIRQVVEKAGAGVFVPPGDDKALADAVRYLHEHADEARAMGRSGRDYVAEHFDRRRHVEAFARLLERLSANPIHAENRA